MPYYLGIDLGTSGLKAVLVREDGRICGIGTRGYPIDIPSPSYAEQDPEEWVRAMSGATIDALAASGVAPDEVLGIGFSGQMHGTVVLSDNGAPLHPAIIWCDQRSTDLCARIKAQIGVEKIGQWTQNPLSPGFQAATLCWLKEEGPELYKRIRHALLPKDYLRYRLTGEIATERTDAAATLLFDCAAGDWSYEMLAALDIDSAILPDATHLPMDIAGGLTDEGARLLGLRAGTAVVYGGGDQPMQALGNGILRGNCASITIGTGGQVLMPVSAPEYDPLLRTHTFCHVKENSWYMMGATLNACLSYNWFLEKVLHTGDFAGMDEEAARAVLSINAPFFLPYLTGERTPHMNPNAQGIFFGLALGHDRGDMARAVLEGVAFSLIDAMEVVESLGHRADTLILSGGGAKSALWRQMIADVSGRRIVRSGMAEQAGVGAALCAMVGHGEYGSIDEACAAVVRHSGCAVEPDERAGMVYRERLERFRAIYRANKELWKS